MPRFPQFASSTGGLSDQVFGKLAAQAKQLDRHIYPLNVGDTHLPPPMPLGRALGTQEHRYAPVQGLPDLLQAAQEKIARRSAVEVSTDQLQIMSGATAGLAIACAAVLDPGDEVLLPAPYWPLIRGHICSRGAKPVEVPLFHRLNEPGFDPIEPLRAAITERTVALYVNTPNNPTGSQLSAESVRNLLSLAAEHDLWVLSDEVYEDLSFDEQPPANVFTFPGAAERTIAMHSLSKAYGIAGARIGYCHGPAEAMARIRGIQTFHTYCAPTPMQHAAAHILRGGDEWLEQTRQQYAEAARMAADALDVPCPTGGTFLFFDTRPFRKQDEDAEAFLSRCLEAGVMLTPGTASGSHFADWARLCFTVVPLDDLRQALRQLQTTLRPH